MEALVKKVQKERGKKRQWNELLVDRQNETRQWVKLIRDLLDRRMDVFAFFNNHFAGFAPGSAELFLKIWQQEVHGSSE